MARHARSSALKCMMVAGAVGLLLACGTASTETPHESTSPADPTAGDGNGGSGPASNGRPDAGQRGAATESVSDASAPDGIQVLVEPSDKAAALLNAIQNAKKSVHVTMYLLGDSRFVNALIARHQAGVDVAVILNHAFPGGAGSNSAVYAKLQSAGVNVSWAPSGYTMTHEKCVIIDGTAAWIMTMNLEPSSSSNREFLAIDNDASDVAEAEAVFQADVANVAFTPTGSLVVAPTNAREKIVALVQSAKKTVDVEGEELSDAHVASALVAAKQAGVTVRVVLANAAASPAQQSAVQQLEVAGVAVVTVATPYVHAKAVVADGVRAYIGSANFTATSLTANRELGVITNNASAVATVAQTIGHDFANGK